MKQGSAWSSTWGVAFTGDQNDRLSSDISSGIYSVDVYTFDNYFSGVKFNGGNECVGDCTQTKVGTASPGVTSKLYYISAGLSEGIYSGQTFTRIFAITFGFNCL